MTIQTDKINWSPWAQHNNDLAVIIVNPIWILFENFIENFEENFVITLQAI